MKGTLYYIDGLEYAPKHCSSLSWKGPHKDIKGLFKKVLMLVNCWKQYQCYLWELGKVPVAIVRSVRPNPQPFLCPL